MTFRNRQDAGIKLAQKLEGTHKHLRHLVVCALPRGGVVLGVEVARLLDAPLGLAITRKIGHPQNPEYAICAVGQYGEPICNKTEQSQVDSAWLERRIAFERQEIKRRREKYSGNRKIPSLKHKTVILVDDGIATGLTMRAAINDMRALKAKHIFVAVPVVPPDTYQLLKNSVDDVIALSVPTFFRGAIGSYYDEFDQVADAEVIQMLADATAF